MKTGKQRKKGNTAGLLSSLYAYSFFADFVLIFPLYGVMISQSGIQPWQVALLFALWSVTTFVLEVPSGVWADRYSRRNILVLGQVFRGVAFGLWLMLPNFLGFLIGFILWGVECALRSGTFEALLYDELAALGREAEFTKVFGRTRAISSGAMVAAAVLASPAVLLGYPVILGMSCFASVAAALCLRLVPETEKQDSTQEDQPGFVMMLSQGVKTILHTPGVFGLLMFVSLALVFSGALEEYWAIVADQAGMPAYWLGLYIAGITGAEALAGLLAHRFTGLTAPWFYLLFAATGGLLILTGMIFTPPALAIILGFVFISGIIQTVYEGRLQEAIPSSLRATLSSFKGLLVELKALALYAAIGGLAQASGYSVSLAVLGGVILLAGLGFLVFTFLRKVL